jgi:hypothetical protein
VVRQLACTIHSTDPVRGRAVIRALVGEVRVEIDERQIRLVSRHAGIEKALARAAGAPCQTRLVAGAGFAACLLRIPRAARPVEPPTGPTA